MTAIDVVTKVLLEQEHYYGTFEEKEAAARKNATQIVDRVRGSIEQDLQNEQVRIYNTEYRCPVCGAEKETSWERHGDYSG